MYWHLLYLMILQNLFYSVSYELLDQLWTFANVANNKRANVRDNFGIQAIGSVQVVAVTALVNSLYHSNLSCLEFEPPVHSAD